MPLHRSDLTVLAGLSFPAAALAWNYEFTMTHSWRTTVWHPQTDSWLLFGRDAGLNEITINRWRPPAESTTDPQSISLGVGITPICSAVSPGGAIFMGGTPVAGSTLKMARSTNGGTGWSAEATLLSGTEAVTALAFFKKTARWLIGFSTGNSIETNDNDDMSGANTSRTAPNTHARGEFAQSDDSVILTAADSVSTNIVSRSLDGITWDAIDVGATKNWKSAAYDPINGVYVICATDGSIRRSVDDGATWAAGGTVTDSSLLRHFGSVLLAQAVASSPLRASMDGGATWKHIGTGFAAFSFSVGDVQLFITNNGGSCNATHRFGF